MKSKEGLVIALSNFGYIISCLLLYLVAIAIIFLAIAGIFLDISKGSFTVYNLLDEVGLLVFSIAVIDVSKYLMVEEVFKGEGNNHPKEKRRTLTKFAIIIVTALSLESLVLTIETAKTDVTKLVYPVLLLLTTTLLIVGLGLYEKLNASAECDAA